MRKPFVPPDRSHIWPVRIRWTLALISWHRGPDPRRSPHRHRKAGRA